MALVVRSKACYSSYVICFIIFKPFPLLQYDYSFFSFFLFSIRQYFVFVFLIFVVLLVGSILGYVFREKVIQTMRQEMYASLPYYGNRRDGKFGINFRQSNFPVQMHWSIFLIFAFSDAGLGRNANALEMLWRWIVPRLVWFHTWVMLPRDIRRTAQTVHWCTITTHPAYKRMPKCHHRICASACIGYRWCRHYGCRFSTVCSNICTHSIQIDRISDRGQRNEDEPKVSWTVRLFTTRSLFFDIIYTFCRQIQFAAWVWQAIQPYKAYFAQLSPPFICYYWLFEKRKEMNKKKKEQQTKILEN